MGGGGHLGNAATQIKNSSIDHVKKQLVAILNQAQKNEQKEQK